MIYPLKKNERYDNLQLIQWDKPMDNSAWGYYASFKIGAEWIDKQEALVVTAKRGMEKVDFLRMFMTCFCSDLAVGFPKSIPLIRRSLPL